MKFAAKWIGESCSYVLKIINHDEGKKLLKALFQFSINIYVERENVCVWECKRFLERHVKHMSKSIYKMLRMKGWNFSICAIVFHFEFVITLLSGQSRVTRDYENFIKILHFNFVGIHMMIYFF